MMASRYLLVMFSCPFIFEIYIWETDLPFARSIGDEAWKRGLCVEFTPPRLWNGDKNMTVINLFPSPPCLSADYLVRPALGPGLVLLSGAPRPGRMDGMECNENGTWKLFDEGVKSDQQGRVRSEAFRSEGSSWYRSWIKRFLSVAILPRQEFWFATLYLSTTS